MILDDLRGELREQVDPSVILLVAIAIRRGNKVLLVREEAEPYNRQWVLPQGYVKSNETLEAAAEREIREELGVNVGVREIVGIYEDFKQENVLIHYVTVCFLGRLKDLSDIRATHEVVDHVWVNPSKDRTSVSPLVRRMLNDISKVKKKRFLGTLYKFGI